MKHVAVVSLDARARDHLDETWVRDDGATGVRRDLVIEGPGVGGRFEDDRVGGLQMLLQPHCPLAQSLS